MPLGPITLSEVLDAIGLPLSAKEQTFADTCRRAAMAYVEKLPVVQDQDADVREDVRLGTVLLAAHLYQRRSTGAVTPDFDGGFPTQGLDPIVPRLLRLGGYARPVVA